MHGIVFHELEQFVSARFGAAAWPDLLDKAGLFGRKYDPLESYDDGEVLGLLEAATRATGLSADVILEKFGEFIAPDLLQAFWAVVRPEWKALDLLEHTETAIHSVVRLRSPNATPPTLRTERRGPDEVVIYYGSPRKLCALARGIVRGVGTHYDQALEITEPACMHRGAPECVLVIRAA